jgi:polar amino acid transport system substrate-binding protein
MKATRFCALLGLLAAIDVSGARAQETLRVGMAPEPFLPYSTLTEAKQWEGFEPDVLRAVCSAVKVQCNINAIAWDGLIPSLTENKVDLILGAFSINEDRKKIVDFSRPYDHEASNIIGLKSDSAKLGTIADPARPGAKLVDPKTLSGKVVGAQASSTQAMYIQKYLGAVEAKNYDTADNVAADLAAGRIDYAVLPDTYAQTFLEGDRNAEYEVKLTIPDNPVMGEGIGMAVKKGNADLLNRINTALKDLEANGQLAAITKKWFPKRK